MLSRIKFQIVTGAPGTGKSTTVQALLALKTECIVFDIDWLSDSASSLAGRSIYTDASTWEPYRKLWFEILKGISLNHQVTVLFAPISKQDIEGLVDKATISWLLLDCSDNERIKRLEQRRWSQDKIQEALNDANELRQEVSDVIDTSNKTPEEVAKKILEWLTKPA